MSIAKAIRNPTHCFGKPIFLYTLCITKTIIAKLMAVITSIHNLQKWLQELLPTAVKQNFKTGY